MEKIGLIAGNRKFPLLFAREARKRNCSVVAIAIKKDASRRLNSLVDKVYWLSLSEFGRMFEIFKKEGISRVVMAGQITPSRLFSKDVARDPELQKMLDSIKDKRADSIFSAIAERLKNSGIELLDSTIFLEEHLVGAGLLTEHEPEKKIWEDVNFGFAMAKQVAGLDIGQTVAIWEKAIVAVEALEGTDNLIRRAGRICPKGVVVVKVSKPNQDKRFDIPVVGLNTIKNLIKARAKCLAIEAGKTLFFDKKDAVALANKKGIAIIGA